MTTVKSVRRNVSDFSDERLMKLKKQFPEELTYSSYEQLKLLDISDDDIIFMYDIKKNQFLKFVAGHKQKLGLRTFSNKGRRRFK